MSPLDTLDSYEKEAIEELRLRMKKLLSAEKYDDTLMFYRFLRARDFNVDKAEIMLKKHIIWRKAFQVDTILDNFKYPEVCEKYVEAKIIGFDKDGDIVRYAPIGKMESREILKCIKLNDYKRHLIYGLERDIALMKEEKRNGRNCNQWSTILDLDGLTYTNAASKSSLELILSLFNLLQDNYPEYTKSLYVINAPSYYIIIYSILKEVMSSRQKKKMKVFGRNGWKESLLELMDADVLPAFLGGNRTDPDGNPLCLSFISHGEKIPSKYYLSDEERSFKDITQVKQITIQPTTKHSIPIDVKEWGSLIRWEFESKNKDISFGLFFQDSEKEIEIIPIYKFTTSDGVESGSYRAQWKGRYTIVFDNSYSWLSSKEVHYCITVEEPE